MSEARRLLDAAVLGELEGLAALGPAGWEALVDCAFQEGTEGLLYHRCAAAMIRLPETIRGRLDAAYRQVAQHNIVALRQLGDVLAGLSERGVEVVVLPGASLLGLYPDPGCRPMDDIDILARPEDMATTRDFLHRKGYMSPPRHPDLCARGDVVLDLHTDLLNCSRVGARRRAGCMDVEEVFRDRRPGLAEGVSIFAMGPADSVLYTAVHALRHGFSRLVWFLDLHLLLQEGVDWDELGDKARRYGGQRALLYCLRFLRDHTHLDVVGPSGACAAPPDLSALEAWVLERAFRDRRRGEWGDLLWSFSVASPMWRCWFLIATCFPRPAALLQVFPYLPRPLLPLAYGLRLAQLMYRGSRHLAGVFRRPATPSFPMTQETRPR